VTERLPCSQPAKRAPRLPRSSPPARQSPPCIPAPLSSSPPAGRLRRALPGQEQCPWPSRPPSPPLGTAASCSPGPANTNRLGRSAPARRGGWSRRLPGPLPRDGQRTRSTSGTAEPLEGKGAGLGRGVTPLCCALPAGSGGAGGQRRSPARLQTPGQAGLRLPQRSAPSPAVSPASVGPAQPGHTLLRAGAGATRRGRDSRGKKEPSLLQRCSLPLQDQPVESRVRGRGTPLGTAAGRDTPWGTAAGRGTPLGTAVGRDTPLGTAAGRGTPRGTAVGRDARRGTRLWAGTLAGCTHPLQLRWPPLPTLPEPGTEGRDPTSVQR